MLKHYIAYFSAAGTTQQVAHMLENHLRQAGIDAEMLELAPAGGADAGALAATVKTNACLWLGSPVYVDHAVPQVLDFIAALPRGSEDSVAVPFATWGGVCSGVALAEMASHLQERSWQSIAAAKVLAQHSSMWESTNPLAKGHPGPRDEEHLAALVQQVLIKLKSAPVEPLEQEVLNYLPAEYAAESWGKSLEKVKVLLGEHQPEHERCDGCGRCVELCPVGALSWEEGYPVVGENCVRCHQCTRHCSQQAFPFNAAMMEERLQQMAGASPETSQTKVYV